MIAPCRALRKAERYVGSIDDPEYQMRGHIVRKRMEPPTPATRVRDKLSEYCLRGARFITAAESKALMYVLDMTFWMSWEDLGKWATGMPERVASWQFTESEELACERWVAVILYVAMKEEVEG